MYPMSLKQGLRIAYDHMIGSSFEEVLREADAAEAMDAAAQGGSPVSAQSAKKSGAVHTAEMTLLRRPAVFTLAIVWDSPQVGTLTLAFSPDTCCRMVYIVMLSICKQLLYLI